MVDFIAQYWPYLGLVLTVLVLVLVWTVVLLRSKPDSSLPVGEAPDQISSPDEPQPDTAQGAQSESELDVQTESIPELAAPGSEAIVEVPEEPASRMERLRTRLSRAGAIGQALLSILARDDLGTSDYEELEDMLLGADLGLEASEELIETLRTHVRIHGGTELSQIKQVLREKLIDLVDPKLDRSLNLAKSGDNSDTASPALILMVGVNGTGKTTTVGKLARILVAQEKTVLLGAADTFRAAAAEQLQTWGARVGVEVVRAEKEGADPASVAYDTVKEGIERGVDVVVVDTAGRLQNKAGLMDELGKVKRVMEKLAPVNETLLVLDATTGQNGLRQAQVFAEVADISGIVLTKLDGSAKGGIVVSVQRELGVAVKLVGLGEGPDDLAPFDPEAFVDAIMGA